MSLRKKRISIVANLLRNFYLSANFDFNEIASQIVSVLDLHYLKQKDKENKNIIEYRARLQQTRIKFHNKRRISNGKNKTNR